MAERRLQNIRERWDDKINAVLGYSPKPKLEFELVRAIVRCQPRRYASDNGRCNCLKQIAGHRQ